MGRDPRDYVLLPFGGAGPLLAAEIAEELGLSEILVPPNPGVVSALGLLSADFVRVSGVTRRTRLDDATPGVLREAFAQFQRAAVVEFHALGLDGPLAFSLTAEMRFVGQAFEVAVEIDPADLPNLTPADLAGRFAEAHRWVYFHGGEPGRQVEVVGLRFGVRRRLEALPVFRERPIAIEQPESVRVHIKDGTVSARLVQAALLDPGVAVIGPALIEGYSSSTWLPPGWVARVDGHGNLLMKRMQA
jgi:N-methylhydantoinase A